MLYLNPREKSHELRVPKSNTFVGCVMSEIKSKKCNRCGELKPIVDFHKMSTASTGYRPECKICRKLGTSKKIVSEQNKRYYKENKDREDLRCKMYRYENKDKISETQSKYRKKNKIKLAIREKEYRLKNKEKIYITNKKWRKNNTEKVKESQKKWTLNNKDKIKKYRDLNREVRSLSHKRYYTKNKAYINERTRIYRSERLKYDDSFRIKTTIRDRFRAELKSKYTGKNWRVLFGLTGYTLDDYISHFDNVLFEKYKQTSNYHIDHIIPVSGYDFAVQDDINKCWNPRNLRIITIKENKAKKDKICMDLIKSEGIEDLLPRGFNE